MKLFTVVYAAFLTILGLSNSVSPLKCYQWTDDDDSTKAKATACPGSSANQICVLIGLEGSNKITKEKITSSIGMCNSNGCNETRLCNMAYESVKNFKPTKCNARCCESDKCNAIPVSTTSTEYMQTIAIPRVARSTKRVYRTVSIPMPTDDEVEYYVTKETGITCFYCKEGSDLDVCQVNPSESHCGMESDSCVSITGTSSDNEELHVAYRGCGLAEINCNITQLCIDVRNKLFVSEGKEMTSCYGYCCRNDFCNNFNPTQPVRFNTRLKTSTTKSRRTTTLRAKSPPIKCYECRPESFDSMCSRNTTTRMCETGDKGYDSCLTMTAVIRNATTNEVIDNGEWTDCAVRDMDCNANSSRCDSLSDILKSRGLVLNNCLINCCQGDLCNNFTATAGPNITALAISKAQGCLQGNVSIVTGLVIMLSWKLFKS